MTKLFGTDGIRGMPGKEPLTAGTITRIAGAFAAFLKIEGKAGISAVIGKDTRASCSMIEDALASGLVSSGIDVVLLGVIPTAAVAYLTRERGAAGGIMITASHNPADENGIKFFTHKGEKLRDEDENIIESAMQQNHSDEDGKGKIIAAEDTGKKYIEFLLTEASKPNLNGLKIVVDAANGAAYKLLGDVFKTAGADVAIIGNQPDGKNINRDCGALYPQQLQREVVRNRADCGVALDGDADRLVMVDENGAIIDGDALITTLAKKMLQQNRLEKKTVVVTEYSNTALDDELEAVDAKTVRVKNGDKHVYEEMNKNGYSLGGEQSGHIILAGNTTGDGILAALHMAAMMKESGKPLSQLARLDKKPQVLINVEVNEKKELGKLPLTSAAVASAEKKLPLLKGRSLIRYSGTQNVLRIMLEGTDEEEIGKLAEAIAEAAKKEIGK